MKGKERTRYKAFRKLVNRCLFHTLQRYVKDNISYNNTKELIALYRKYNIKFNHDFWDDFVEECQKVKVFKNMTYSYEHTVYDPIEKYYTEYILISRKNDFDNRIDTPIATLDFDLLNQENGILYLQRVMIYYIDCWWCFRRVREFVKINTSNN